MIYSLLWILNYILTLPQYVLALKVSFNPKLSVNRFVYIIVSVCFCLLCFLIRSDFYIIPAFNIALVIITCFSFKASAKIRILYGIFTLFLVNSLAYLFRFPFALIFKPNDEPLNSFLIAIFKMITGIVFFSIILFIKKHRIKSDATGFFNTPLVFSVGICAFLTLACIALVEIAIPYVSKIYPAYESLSTFIVALSYVAIAIFIMFVIKIRQDNYNQKLKAMQERIFFEEQNFYLQKLIDKDEDTKKFRHDFNGYLLNFSTLAKEGKNQELVESIDALLDEHKESSSTVYDVGNDIISSALTYCFSNLANTEININGKITRKLDIIPMDLSIIFYNIFNNVVEAVNNCTSINKYIDINIEYDNNPNGIYLQIQIINSTENNITFDKNSLPITTKNDNKSHGYGTKQIKDLIERNNGFVDFYSRTNEFCTNIQIKTA
ncbi:MAG: ATP-binding protein [Lachnospiraceae bacterium]|nr:ATP-binding protein [Lachnospiraceae bacterium]